MEKHHIGFDIWLPNLSMMRCSARKLLPTPGNVLFTLLVVGGLLFVSRAGALPLKAPMLAGNSTTTISYQGRLADSAGNPITTPGVAMQFRLYDADTGGTPLWEETQAAVPVEDGLFHVLLGSTNPIPVSLLASNSILWLGITVGSDSEMTPREQIASAPYAMIASTVPDGAITTGMLADGAVTQAKLGADVSLEPPDGSITTAKLADGAVTSAKLEHSGPHIPITPDENGLVKIAVMRQDNTTNSYRNNQVILTGWGFVRDDGEQLYKGGSVSFGLTFSEVPIVIVGALGRRDNSDPVSIEDFSTDHWFSVRAYNATRTGFHIMVSSVHADTGPIPTNARIGWSWIAIGTLD